MEFVDGFAVLLEVPAGALVLEAALLSPISTRARSARISARTSRKGTALGSTLLAAGDALIVVLSGAVQAERGASAVGAAGPVR